MNEQLDELYRDIIMDHYRNPRGKRKLDKVDIKNEGKNPVCGDEIEMQVELEDDKVKDIHVGCMGCAISVSSGSILAEMVKGKSLSEVKKIAETVRALLRGERVPDDIDVGDLEVLEGIKQFPVRVKCALLSWTTLVDALESYEKGKEVEFSTTE